MIDFLKSLLEASRDRLKNPILGTYSICFLVCNWRPVLFLIFSKASIEDKIVVVNIEYCWLGAILWPIFLTIIITFGIPYIMLLVDLSLVSPKKNRRQIKHNENIISLDEQIEVATKEFEIQNRKSGTKTIESLQENISLLEKEKQSLQSSFISERESNVSEVNRLNELLKNEVDKNTKSASEPLISFTPAVFEMYNYLQNADKLDEYYEYFDGYTSSLNLDDETIKFYRNLGLAGYKDGRVKYTELGYEVYHLLFETKNSTDSKRDMSIMITKLNNHEISEIKEITAENEENFSVREGFRRTIVADLVDGGFFLKHSNGTYELTELGVALRNLMSLNSH